MPADLSRRELQFGISWSLANGLGLATVILAAVHATSRLQLNSFWMIGTGMGLGLWAISIVQQVLLLRSAQISARCWWLTSGVGWGLTSCLGMFNEEMVLTFAGKLVIFDGFENLFTPILLAMLAGAIFGGIQMWSCSELRRQPSIWPIANGVAFAIVMLILTLQRGIPAHWRMTAYLIAFAAGVAYGTLLGQRSCGCEVRLLARRDEFFW
jgi:hypothetical protein